MIDSTRSADRSPGNPVRHRPPLKQTTVAAFVVGILAAVLLWSFWPTLELLAERWSIDPQYSHGFLVPIFAVVILYVRRPETVTWQPSIWGLLILAVSISLRWFSARLDWTHVDGACFVGALLGTTLLVGGWEVFRWSAPAILFLAFMVPLPDVINDGIAVPLRRLATIVSTYVLQTFGYPAIAEGNTIQIDDIRLGVVHACSGLGMLMTFLALATAMAIIVPGPLIDRCVLVASAVPIAVFANVFRITVVAMVDVHFGEDHHDLIDKIFGLPMMLLALLLLWLVWKYLKALLISTGDVAPLSVPLSPWVERAKSTHKPLWS